MKKYSDTFIWTVPNFNIKEIEMTVALPAYNAESIIWLALESLKNQVDITFKWELICFEEYGYSREIIKEYVNKLPGAIRIIHRSINPEIEGIRAKLKPVWRNKNKIKRTGTYPLIWKWINIAKLSAPSSKIFVMHATDDYSPTKRLSIHYQHFNNPKCVLSSQPVGIFYNIISKQLVIYNSLKSAKLYTYTQPNMSYRMEHVRKYVTPKTKFFNIYIDSHIRECIIKGLNIRNLSKEHHLHDYNIDPDNWKTGLYTDGYNNISMNRRKVYDITIEKGYSFSAREKSERIWGTPTYFKHLGYTDINNYIPKNVMDKLNIMYYHKNNVNVLLNDMQSNMINITKQIDKSKPAEIQLVESFSTNSDITYMSTIILLVLIIGILKLKKIF